MTRIDEDPPGCAAAAEGGPRGGLELHGGHGGEAEGRDECGRSAELGQTLHAALEGTQNSATSPGLQD